MNNLISEKTSQQFRETLKSLNYSEKGSELTSGGELQSDFVNIIDSFVKDWFQIDQNKVCPLKFTAGNDAFHKRITKYVSRHTKGEAVDITLPQNCHSSFKQLLNQYKSKYNGFNYIDEYTNPTSMATGGHFHLSYREGQPEGGSKESSNSKLNSQTNTQTNTKTNTKTDFTGTRNSKTYDEPKDKSEEPPDESVKSAYGFMEPFISTLKPLEKQMQDNIDKMQQSESKKYDDNLINEINHIKKMMNL